MEDDNYIRPICCPQGEKACADCFMSNNVNSATICSQCHQQMGKKMAARKSEIRQTHPNYAQAFNLKHSSKPSGPINYGQDMLETQKKQKGPKNPEQYPQQYYNQNYPNFYPNMNMHGNYPQQNMHTNYPQQFMPYGWGPNYYGQMPPHMMANHGPYPP